MIKIWIIRLGLNKDAVWAIDNKNKKWENDFNKLKNLLLGKKTLKPYHLKFVNSYNETKIKWKC